MFLLKSNTLEKFSKYTPCPTACCRAAWNAVPLVLQNKYILRGELFLNFSWPFLSSQDWLDFTKTGNRSDYEETFFSKRRALSDLVMAECCEHKGRFMEDIVNGIYSITAETAWWLPAHNSYIRDTLQLPLPDTQRPIVELFSAETGALLAMTCYLLKSELDAISLFICSHVISTLNQRIIKPYLTEHFWWMGNGNDEMCNWTPWCTQNILLTAFLTEDFSNDYLAIVKKATYSLDCFVNSYGDDGCCNEGAQYYHHAALTLFGAFEVLCATNEATFLPLYKNKKIGNMAAYIMQMHVHDDYYINYADCSPFAGRRGHREYLFAKRTENKSMQAFAAAEFKASLTQPDQNSDIARINLFYIATEAFCAKEMLAYNEPLEPRPDVYYPSAGVFIARDSSFCLSVKAGNNGEGHNHNDTGSIILYKNNKPFLIDLGVESYTKRTFSQRRYEIWTMQSAWHNLPTFDGVMQRDGKQFGATDINTIFGEQKSTISMNIALAYPDVKMQYYNRSVCLHKGGNITLIDKTDFDGEVVLSLITSEMPKVSVRSIQIGTVGSVEVLTPCIINYEAVEITDNRLRIAWPQTIYRLQLKFEKTIEIEIS